ncbi:CHASE domain-containing protein [Perlucidibaca aquatica]|uniref:CHASE domain-containing protein n=1 Tax=Perlucidibaca aquatica TaxID=1852776 RepID=UPI0009EDFA2C|nr:CHASE domain-containing protein [Perlucidibaca aquatica]
MTKLRRLNARVWLISKLRSYSPLAFALSLFVVGTLLTSSISYLIYIQYKNNAQLEFESESKYAVGKIQNIISSYEIVLRDLRSLIYSVGLENINRKNFKDYFVYRNVAQEFPGANGLGFVRKVKQNDLDRFINLTRNDGYADFKVKNFFPYNGDNWIIEYLEPSSSNKLAIGLNLASEPSRLKTIGEAIKSGRAMLTPPITLVQNKNKINNGLLFILPIYHPFVVSKNNPNKKK